MKTLLLCTKLIGLGIKKIIFLLIEVICLAYMLFRVTGAIAMMVFYGVKLSVVRHHYRVESIKESTSQ